jgi:Ca-activated chloride channel family protein
VILQATVRNQRGEVVTNLGREAFTVYENGKKQVIEAFARDDVPVSIGLLIDNSGSMGRLRAAVEAAALGCVKASNPEDEVFVLNFADKVHIDVPFTRDAKVLEDGIGRVDSIGGTAMRDAVHVALGYLHDHARRQRRALLVITDGVDNASVITNSQVRRHAEANNVVIYAVGLLSEESDDRAKRARRDLDELSDATGGTAYYPTRLRELRDVALTIARQIRSQYTLAFTPSDRSLDGSYRKLRVTAQGAEHLIVRTRPGYRGVVSKP